MSRASWIGRVGEHQRRDQVLQHVRVGDEPLPHDAELPALGCERSGVNSPCASAAWKKNNPGEGIVLRARSMNASRRLSSARSASCSRAERLLGHGLVLKARVVTAADEELRQLRSSPTARAIVIAGKHLGDQQRLPLVGPGDGRIGRESSIAMVPNHAEVNGQLLRARSARAAETGHSGRYCASAATCCARHGVDSAPFRL